MLKLNNNGVVTPEPETLRVKGFKEIWEKDKGKNKDKALNIYAYIYFKYNPKSSYKKSSVGEELQKRLLEEVIQNPSWKIPKYVKIAEDIYERNMSSVGMKLLESALIAAEGVATLYKDFNFDDIEDENKKLSLASSVLSGLSKVDEVVVKISRAFKRLEEELLSENKKKKDVNRFELPPGQR